MSVSEPWLAAAELVVYSRRVKVPRVMELEVFICLCLYTICLLYIDWSAHKHLHDTGYGHSCFMTTCT